MTAGASSWGFNALSSFFTAARFVALADIVFGDEQRQLTHQLPHGRVVAAGQERIRPIQ